MTSFFFESGFKGYLNEYVIHAFILNTPNYAMSYACSRLKQSYTNYLCRAPDIAGGINFNIFSDSRGLDNYKLNISKKY